MASADKNRRPIIIVKKKVMAAAHHGGAWKVAYADFVTAMMAFFLVMWLVTAVSKDQRAAIFDYFKNPSMEPGKSVKPAPGQMGPGGASTSAIDLGGGLDAPRTTQSAKPGVGMPTLSLATRTPSDEAQLEAAALEQAREQLEKKKLEALMDDLKEAIGKSQALEPFKDQLLLDITSEGMRIQIVDAQNRPMFDIGSSSLKSYTVAILREITPYLKSVPNRISLTGHTDTTPYRGITGTTNWDLSADRANAARRVLEGAGLSTERVSRVVGLSSSALFDKTNPRNPINRRISIVVLTKAADEEALKTDVPVQIAQGEAADGEASAGGATATAAAAANGLGARDPLPAGGAVAASPDSGPIAGIDRPFNLPMAAAPIPVQGKASAAASATAKPSPKHPLQAAPR
jgi:chemotaxis protein MotB